MEERTLTKGFLLGLMTGGLIGSIAALLYAPRSGRKLRRDIRNKSKELLNETGDFIENKKNQASEIISDGMEKAENLIKDARNKAVSILADGKDLLTNETSKRKTPVKETADTFNDDKKLHKEK
jgi:gas vesicle protein